MPGPEVAELQFLAEKRGVRISGAEVERTPLLVPAFSSRVPDIEKIFRASEQFVDGPILISAYDVGHSLISPPYDFASLIFLDSGGYEVSEGLDLSDVGGGRPRPDDWSPESHARVLDAWDPHVPCVVVSYDHPKLRRTFPEQIQAACGLASGVGRELLLKPETREQDFIKVDSLAKCARDLHQFDVIGVTEKEIGNSILERMKNIARLRLLLRTVGLETPLHVFGSLDTVTTFFYFVAGADVFDGLSWLRYAFKDGSTLYRQNYGALDLGIATKSPLVEALCWSKNHQYMGDMQLEMRRFLKDHDFGVFRHHGRQLADAYKSIEEELGA